MQTSPDISLANENSKPTSTRVTRAVQLRKLLKRKSGVTIAELEKTFGWQPHTARAAISAQRKSGVTIDRTTGKNGSVYRIIEEGRA